MAALTLENLSVSRNGAAVLRDVSFSVESGGFLSIVGPNGAGKTTILRTILQFIKAHAGRVIIEGKDATLYTRNELGRLISYVPQQFESSFPYTVSEFVIMSRYASIGRYSRIAAAEYQKGEEALKRIGILDLKDKVLNELSGGERQKVLVAAAFASGAELLLLDEPLTYLDPKAQFEVEGTLLRLREHGVTVIAVSHDINSILSLSTRIVGLKEGAVLYSGTPAEFLREETLKELYSREFSVMLNPKNGRTIAVRS